MQRFTVFKRFLHAANIAGRKMTSLFVLVGSTNKVKIDAAAAAFTAAFPSHTFHFEGLSVPSGVSDQPMGDEETRLGSCNRAVNAAKAYVGAGKPIFAVGLEGGCAEETVALPPSAASAVPARESALVCFAWMSVLHVPSGRWGYGKSGTFALPPAVASLVRSGVELGVADDRVFGRTNSKQQDGAVGLLTHGLHTRTDYYIQAMTMALIPFISRQHYFGEGDGTAAATTAAAAEAAAAGVGDGTAPAAGASVGAAAPTAVATAAGDASATVSSGAAASGSVAAARPLWALEGLDF